MTTDRCHYLRESLLDYTTTSTKVERATDSCIATIPIPTIDGRLTDVFVDTTVADSLIVHDGGKAVNELILQGMRITDSVTDHFRTLAKRFGVIYDSESFSIVVKQRDVQASVFAVGMCSALAIGYFAGQVAPMREEPMRNQFEAALKRWAKRKYTVTTDFLVQGKRSSHRFDFVASEKMGRRKPIGLSILAPGNNPLAAAQRFGFIASDLDSTNFHSWPRVAVESRSEIWSSEAKGILRKCADVVIEIPTDSRIDANILANRLSELDAVA